MCVVVIHQWKVFLISYCDDVVLVPVASTDKDLVDDWYTELGSRYFCGSKDYLLTHTSVFEMFVRFIMYFSLPSYILRYVLIFKIK